MKLGKALNRYRVEDGKHFRLKDHDTADTGKMKPGSHSSEMLTKGVARLAELQDKLYAQDRWGILLIFQAMDAAGKDGAIKHVMSGVNPQGFRSIRSSSHRLRNWTTISCGEPTNACLKEDASVSSTARTTRKSWLSGYIRNSSRPSIFPRSLLANVFGNIDLKISARWKDISTATVSSS